ncbi:MAG: glycosyltransferase family 2 protein [Oscillospiraceae bacterium]|nr:glycosyltransferase family 2 protein [Oscillospiraceae bacterium]
MSDSVSFSILVPVYNVAPYLRQCVDSVLGQSDPRFELLLVDDGSTDESGAICDEYAARDKRVRVFHKANGGLMSARRCAIERAGGDYCVFLDSDDYLELNTLETLRTAIDVSGADCVIYGFRWLKPSATETVRCDAALCSRLITDKRAVLNTLLNDDSYNSLCRKCVRRSCFDGRDFSPFFHIKRGEDRIQSTEILENAQSFYFLPDTLYNYRVNDSSITHTVSFDGYRADYTVDEQVLESLRRMALFTRADYDRLRNHLLDTLVIELKRICRYCSDKANSFRAMDSVRSAPFFREFLREGYRRVPAPEGQQPPSRVRRFFNRLAVYLLRRGRLGALYFLNTRVYRAR